MRAAFFRFKKAYIGFVEKQGFPIIVTLCIAVITATAIWTSKREDTYVSPTPPVVDHVSAAQLLQQSLKDTVTPAPASTVRPKSWKAPLATTCVVRPFSTRTMVQNETSGIWSFHDAVDLKASSGEQVSPIADGVIIATGKDRMHGAWMQIDHGDGVKAFYAGMALISNYLAGDSVFAGDTIGFAGNTFLDETGLGPHLHLRVTKDDVAVDPLSLWKE